MAATKRKAGRQKKARSSQAKKGSAGRKKLTKKATARRQTKATTASKTKAKAASARTQAGPKPAKPKKAPSAKRRGPPLPTKVSEVASWLKAMRPLSAAVVESLGRRPKQKAAEQAAAIRALALVGTDAALRVLQTYKPLDDAGDGEFGTTYTDPVAKELVTAWDAFDRREFARRVFRGIGMLSLENAPPLANLGGLEVVDDLFFLQMRIAPGCDLKPLTRLAGLANLYIEDVVDADGVAAIAEIGSLSRLLLAVAADTDISPLQRLGHLKKVKLVIAEGCVSQKMAKDIRAHVTKGVEYLLYESSWSPNLAKAFPGVTVVKAYGFVALTKDRSRAADLREAMAFNSFLIG